MRKFEQNFFKIDLFVTSNDDKVRSEQIYVKVSKYLNKIII